MIQEYSDILVRSVSRFAIHKKFLSMLAKRRIPRFDLEVHSVHDEVFSAIDCTRCGNCCRVLGPKFNTTDINRFAHRFKSTPTGFRNRFLREDEDGDLVFQKLPCPFIDEHDLCVEYDDRPRACRQYPHTDEKNMQGKLSRLAVNSRYCPAAALIVEKLMEKFG